MHLIVPSISKTLFPILYGGVFSWKEKTSSSKTSCIKSSEHRYLVYLTDNYLGFIRVGRLGVDSAVVFDVLESVIHQTALATMVTYIRNSDLIIKLNFSKSGKSNMQQKTINQQIFYLCYSV